MSGELGRGEHAVGRHELVGRAASRARSTPAGCRSRLPRWRTSTVEASPQAMAMAPSSSAGMPSGRHRSPHRPDAGLVEEVAAVAARPRRRCPGASSPASATAPSGGLEGDAAVVVPLEHPRLAGVVDAHDGDVVERVLRHGRCRTPSRTRARRHTLRHLPSICRMTSRRRQSPYPPTDGTTLAGDLWLPEAGDGGGAGPGRGDEPRLLRHPVHGAAPVRRGVRRRRHGGVPLRPPQPGWVRRRTPPGHRSVAPDPRHGHVVGWLADRPEVDADRLGAWGSSFSGGEVIVLGAVDRRVRAVVANAPFAGLGDLDPATDTEARYEAIEAVLSGERQRCPPRHRDRAHGGGAAARQRRAAFLPQPESCGVVPRPRSRHGVGEPLHPAHDRRPALRPVRVRIATSAPRRC